jgi:hypothetical protein
MTLAPLKGAANLRCGHVTPAPKAGYRSRHGAPSGELLPHAQRRQYIVVRPSVLLESLPGGRRIEFMGQEIGNIDSLASVEICVGHSTGTVV